MKGKRIISLMLSVFVAFGLVFVSTGDVKADSVDWYIAMSDTEYANMPIPTSVEVFNDDGEAATVTSVKSSNKKSAKVSSYEYDGETYYLVSFKAIGKAKITVKYKTPDGETGTLTQTVTVKKYPKPFKSLKVNGKTKKVSKNKYMCEVTKYKKTTAKVKMALNKGWKIADVSVTANDYSANKTKEIKVSKSAIKKGKAFKFPKKYDSLDINIGLKKGSKYMNYYIFISR